MFTLGLNTAINTHYFEKSFEEKLFGIEFCTRKSVRAYVLSPPVVELQRFAICIIFQKWQIFGAS